MSQAEYLDHVPRAYVDVFQHVGPWSEEEYFALPDYDQFRWVELLDGALVVNPPPAVPHQRLNSRLWQALDIAAPPGYEALEGVGVRVAPGSILIPDLTVTTSPGLEGRACEPRDVAMVVELVSTGSLVNDRAIKPRLYASVSIPVYLRIERDQTAIAYRCEHGDYVQTQRVPPGEPLRLTEPFPVTLDIAALATATRPQAGPVS